MNGITKITVIVGVALILIGGGAYVASGMGSTTALIPAGIGGLLAICGLVSRTPRATMIAMHLAALIALIGASSLGMAFAKWSTLLDERPLALAAMIASGTVCVVLLVLYIRSFIAARKKPAE